MSDQSVTHSIAVDELSLAQLVQLSQGIARDIDKLRAQRQYLKAKIDERLALGESDQPAGGNAEAPGAVIDLSMGG
jgi:hypothetical protein